MVRQELKKRYSTAYVSVENLDKDASFCRDRGAVVVAENTCLSWVIHEIDFNGIDFYEPSLP